MFASLKDLAAQLRGVLERKPEPRDPADLSIHIHSIWRTASTYHWQKIRDAEAVMAFYEPFHPAISWLEEPATWRKAAADSGLGHSGRDSYWREYRGVIETKGVAFFRREFELDQFIVRSQAEFAGQRAFLGNLLAHARDQGRIPCLGYVRSCARIGWIRREFGGLHIGLIRNPYFQYMAYIRRIGFMEDCEEAVARILPSAPPPLVRLYDAHVEGSGDGNDRQDNIRVATFAFYYVLNAVFMIAHAEHVFDVDRMGASGATRRAYGRLVSAYVGETISYADCRPNEEIAESHRAYLPRLRACLEGYLGLLKSSEAAALEACLMPCDVAFVRPISEISDMLEEKHYVSLVQARRVLGRPV